MEFYKPKWIKPAELLELIYLKNMYLRNDKKLLTDVIYRDSVIVYILASPNYVG